jgi:hypothetical protein
LGAIYSLIPYNGPSHFSFITKLSYKSTIVLVLCVFYKLFKDSTIFHVVFLCFGIIDFQHKGV